MRTAARSERLLTRFPRLRDDPASRVIVHGKTSLAPTSSDEQEFRAVLPGLDLDDERALLVARQQDVVCTLSPVEEAYLTFLESLEVGPGHARVITIPADATAGAGLPKRLGSDPATLRRIAALLPPNAPVVLEPYIATEAEFALADALGAVIGREVAVLGGARDVVARWNAKDQVRMLAQELGIPVADGEVVVIGDAGSVDSRALQPALERQLRPTGRVILRGSRGAAGSSVRAVERTVTSIEAALEWAAGRSHDPVYLVEVMLPVTVSPNIQMFMDEGGVHCAGITDQRLNGGLMHQGSVYPTRAQTIDRMLEYAQIMSKRLRADGFTGLAGIDFCEYAAQPSGRPSCFFAEINPRINGSTYPLVLASLLDPDYAAIGGFVCGRIRPAARSFAETAEQHADLLLDRERCQGALPYNVGYLPRGLCHLVVFERTREAALARWEGTVAALAGESFP